MKKLLTFLFCFSLFSSYGQTVIYNSTSKMDSLDNIYQALVTDTFPGLTQKVVPEYSKLLKGLRKHLSTNDFYWESDYEIYARFFANAEGNVEIFLCRFLGSSISDAKEKEFNGLLKSYFSENKFDLDGTVSMPFSVGGCTSFKATKKENN
jgi:hypothetical protein